MLFNYKEQIFETESLTITKLVPPRAYCLLHACHTFCDELISLL